MSEPGPSSLRRDAVLVAFASAIVALAAGIPRMPPSADLPHYEFLIAALRGLGDPSRFPSPPYEYTLSITNQLFVYAAWLLSFVLPVDLAVRVLFAGVIGAMPALAARAAWHAGRSPLVGVVVAPLSLGFAYRWCLSAYLLGLCLLLAALPDLRALQREPTPHRALRGIGWAALLGFAHGSSIVLLLTLTLGLAMQRGRRLRDLGLLMAPVLGGLVVFAIGWITFRARVRADTSTPLGYGIGLAVRPGLLPWTLFGPLDPWAMYTLPLMLAAGMGALRRGARVTLDRPLFMAAALCFVQFFLWPNEFGGAGLLFQRFTLPAVLFLVLALPSVSPRSHFFAGSFLALPVVMVVALWPLTRITHYAWRDLDAVIARVAPGSAVASLDLAEIPWAMHVFGGAAARVVALRGGVTHSDFSYLPQFPVRTRQDYLWARTRVRLMHPQDFIPTLDFQRFRYVVVRTTRRHDLAALTRAMAPEGRLVLRSGRWMLYASTLPVLPLTAREPDLPPRRPPSLGARIAAMGVSFPFPRGM